MFLVAEGRAFRPFFFGCGIGGVDFSLLREDNVILQ